MFSNTNDYKIGMMMIQRHQIYPSFDKIVKKEDDTNETNGIAICAIEETESVCKLVTNHENYHRNTTNSTKHSDKDALSSTSVQIQTAIVETSPSIKNLNESSKYNIERLIKRSSSVDDKDDYYDTEIEDRIIKQSEHRKYYDSETEGREDDIYDSNDDTPLDLSLPSERRRNPNISDTESDDSASAGDDKALGKAAYKKNLMKRYRK